TIIEQLNRQLKIDIRKDLISWMGPAAIFARGTNLTDIGGAVVVQSTDPAATKKAIPVIERLLTLFGGDAGVKTSPLSASGVDAGFRVTSPQLPLPVNVALAGDKFIVALTDPALQAAIKPSGTLGDNAGYKDAAEALGDGLKPALYVGFPPILSLLDGFGLTSDPEFKQFEPTAKALQALAAGGQTDDEVTRGRVVLTLND
ncbi:MAG: hypothetical protein JHC95_19595, partial [Solirubrobacteraceae bacterium]|nr:hypothetical protein [Solirubrobacteraceae bacterium]